MGLFGPFWKTENTARQEKIVERVRRVNDQALLRQIAAEAPLYSVKRAAVGRIHDAAVLRELAFLYKTTPIGLEN